MNDQIRHHGRQAARWADDGAKAKADGYLEQSVWCLEQARKHQQRMRELQREAFLAGEFEQVS